MRHAFRRRHNIQAVPEAVDEIDVSMTGRAKHDFGARGPAFGRMGRQILGAHVGFRFHDASDPKRAGIVMHQVHTDEITGDRKSARGVEVAWNLTGLGHGPAWYSHSRYFGIAASAWAIRTSFLTLFTP